MEVNDISDHSDVPTTTKSTTTVTDDKPAETNWPRETEGSKSVEMSRILLHRKELKDKHPSLSPTDFSKIVAEEWAKMTPEQKESYIKQANNTRQTYSEAKAAYDAQLLDEAAVVNTAANDSAAAFKKPCQSKLGPISIKKPIQSPPSASGEESDN
ncbi:hypothetical protein D9758_004932 [Tetrapyrgos nigripes]|uniref:HMG box domain-containing protein n=1 Tax=Tetrapyrgos nigripes TaxID=182062 RepID=A0A8H5LW54_9AGAR|nr:hypothetical protein D9758_004932 [Tetrapyrgos nigripes]